MKEIAQMMNMLVTIMPKLTSNRFSLWYFCYIFTSYRFMPKTYVSCLFLYKSILG